MPFARGIFYKQNFAGFKSTFYSQRSLYFNTAIKQYNVLPLGCIMKIKIV